MDALDDLLSELEGPKPTAVKAQPPAPSRSTSVAAPSATDDLDSLLNDLACTTIIYIAFNMHFFF